MFKSWSRVCVLVLALQSFSRGQDSTTTESLLIDDDDSLPDSPDLKAKETELTTPSLQNSTSGNGTKVNQADVDPIDVEGRPDLNSTKDGNSSAASETTTSVSAPTTVDQTTFSTTQLSTLSTLATSAPPVPTKPVPAGGSSWAYVLLVLIILVIIVLCIILYLLRRASRTYTFDLQRPLPSNNLNEPTGTFEHVYLDDRDPPAPKDEIISDDISSTPVANGTTLQPEDRSSNGDDAPQDQQDSNGVETSPRGDTSSTSGDEQADNHSTNSANLFFDAIGEEQQQNENNNNQTVGSSDPFVEINLEDLSLDNQLLTPEAASSSVLPFSPFSFSTSSS